MTIEGVVRDASGRPIPSLEIVAERLPLPGEPGGAEFQTLADANGRFRFDFLRAGEYAVRNEARAPFAVTERVVPAGSGALTLVVPLHREIALEGSVTDPSKRGLKGVRVTPLGQPDDAVYTNRSGEFRLRLAAAGADASRTSLRFHLGGYRPVEIAVGDDPGPIDVVLERNLRGASVRGSLVDAQRHEPVGRAEIILRSRTTSAIYRVDSSPEGAFAISGVELGEYRVSVIPRGPFKTHTIEELMVAAEGAELRIALDRLDRAPVRGRLVDRSGHPVRNYRLWLASPEAPTERATTLESDEQGEFRTRAPVGRLRFYTRAEPARHVEWTRESVSDDIELVIDVGENTLEGRITDSAGVGIAGASVELRWAYAYDAVVSQSVRRTVGGPDGYFEFEGLADDAYSAHVEARGYEPTTVKLDVTRRDRALVELKRR